MGPPDQAQKDLAKSLSEYPLPRFGGEGSGLGSECPDAPTLQAFAVGGLSLEEIEAIGCHLAGCDVCEKALAELVVADDSFIAELKHCEEPGLEDPEFRLLSARLRQIPTFLKAGSASRELESGGISHEPVSHQLGQYRLLEKIGQGSMGTVYRARHMKLKRDVVLKLLSTRRLNDEYALTRFSREAEAVGKLDDHPNIVRARDAGEIDGHHFLVMDYLEGLDVGHLLLRVGTLSVPDACEIVRQAALGLEYAHQHGVVHRDVKPSNLLLTVTGTVKLLDLGLATIRQDARYEDADGELVGTADYMAPEQWTEGAQVDIRADIYSLGCTLYKLLTGKTPFSEVQRGHRAKMRAHLKAPIVAASTRCPAVPSALDAALSRMLAKTPGERYERPAEVASALEPFATGCDLEGLTRTLEQTQGDTGRFALDVTLGEHRTRLPARTSSHAHRWGLAAAMVVLSIILVFVAADPSWFGRSRLQPLFLQQPDTVLWEYDAKRDLLHVQSNGLAMFRLGSTESDSFALETTLMQEEWQGGLGIFLGYSQIAGEQGSQRTLQTVELRRNGGTHSSRGYELVRTVVRIVTDGSGGEGCTIDELAAVPLPGPVAGVRHHLKVVIRQGKLASALWDGAELTALAPDATDSGSWKEDSVKGEFGVFATHGPSRFRRTNFYTE